MVREPRLQAGWASKPPPVAPPPELRDLHFNDKFVHFSAGSS
jgi:hypothetical protein